jgi:hypothetical protein
MPRWQADPVDLHTQKLPTQFSLQQSVPTSHD